MVGTRRQQMSAVGAILSISYAALYLSGVDSYPSLHRAAGSLSFFPNPDPNEGYCTRQDVSDGWWEETDRFTSIDEIPDAYGYRSWKHNYCAAPGAVWNGGITSGPPQSEEDARKVSVASPKFVKANGCSYRDAEFRDKIIHMLRMPAGAFLVGDSLGLQIMRAHENIFSGGSSPVIVTSVLQGGWEWYPLSRHLVLDRDHPDTELLLSDAGVSIERLDYPLLTWYRTWHLLWHDRLFEAFKGIPEFDFHDQNTKINVLDWYAELTKTLAAAAARVKYEDGVEDEPTSILFHGGPHFSREQLGLQLTNEQLLQGYSRTVDMIEDLMRPLPVPLNLYWQTTVPAHIDCVGATKFNNSLTDTHSPLDKDKKLYNYDIFFGMVTYLRHKFWDDTPRRHQKAEFRSADTINPPMRLMDTFDMSVKRPEAHRGPPDDCLHFCSTGVPDEWVKYWWHLMLEERANTD